jgi:hypothetical protein
MDDILNKVYAGLGLVIGLMFVYISIDLLTNGRVTDLWNNTSMEVGSDD